MDHLVIGIKTALAEAVFVFASRNCIGASDAGIRAGVALALLQRCQKFLHGKMFTRSLADFLSFGYNVIAYGVQEGDGPHDQTFDFASSAYIYAR